MTLAASAPGRICLFGEHQDYLGLPVTAAAINLRCRVDLMPRKDRLAVFQYSDLHSVERLDLDALAPRSGRNYALSVLHLAREQGWLPLRGFDMMVRSDIPRAAGTSSSTAFVLAITAALAAHAGHSLTTMEQVRLAHQAEVVAFQEPGGMMDHLACGLGGLRAMSFSPNLSTEVLAKPDIAWVLGDSLTPKDTLKVLAHAKGRRLDLLSRMPFDVANATEVPDGPWAADERALLEATLANRDISAAGTRALIAGDVERVGAHLSAHHAILRDALRLSTPRIEAMLEQAMKHGALGGKINGSGGGGCCFVMCRPADAEEIAAAMSAAGGLGMPIALTDRGVVVQKLTSP